MPDLTISVRGKELSDKSLVYDVHLRQDGAVIVIPAYSRADAERIATTIAGTVEACASILVALK